MRMGGKNAFPHGLKTLTQGWGSVGVNSKYNKSPLLGPSYKSNTSDIKNIKKGGGSIPKNFIIHDTREFTEHFL